MFSVVWKYSRNILPIFWKTSILWKRSDFFSTDGATEAQNDTQKGKQDVVCLCVHSCVYLLCMFACVYLCGMYACVFVRACERASERAHACACACVCMGEWGENFTTKIQKSHPTTKKTLKI